MLRHTHAHNYISWYFVFIHITNDSKQIKKKYMASPEDDFSKKKDISLAADWGESEPWTQFLSEFSPHKARTLGWKENVLFKQKTEAQIW